MLYGVVSGCVELVETSLYTPYGMGVNVMLIKGWMGLVGSGGGSLVY